MKKLLQRIWAFIKLMFDKTEDETKKYVPIAIGIVQGIKKVVDSPVDDIVFNILRSAIPGEADDIIINKVKSVIEKWVPKLLKELIIIDSIANIEDPNEQLKIILAQFKLSSSETKNIVYHGLASLIIEKLADGKLTWSESVAISEYYYKNFPIVE